MSQPFDWTTVLQHPQGQALLQLAITEDIGKGDVTTESIFAEAQAAEAAVVARQSTVMCGGPVVVELYRRIDPALEVELVAAEGADVPAGAELLRLRGDVRAILKGERCALNFLMRLGGIARAARRAVAAVPPQCPAQIFDTRKTVPGWRLFDKAAVHIGGAQNHRFGLHDQVLIKDNHVAAAGSVAEAIKRARAHAPADCKVEVEIDRLEQLDEALRAQPDIILLDNFTLDHMRQAVQLTANRAQLEASGGLTTEQVAAVARTGVHRISLGALTHTVQPVDLSMELPAPPVFPIVHLPSVDSTMLEAKRRAPTSPGEGLTIVAREQTAGRGRRGRTWFSPAGAGLWMTTVLRPHTDAAHTLAFVAGVAALEVAHRLGATNVRLKWPNDLTVGDRKLAGILLEGETHPEGLLVLVGIGLNVAAASSLQLPADIAERYVGLAELVDTPPPMEQLAAMVVRQLSRRYLDWQQHGLAPILETWGRWDGLRDQTVEVEKPGGAGRVVGVARGLHPSGALRVEVSGEEVLITSGEVHRIRVSS